MNLHPSTFRTVEISSGQPVILYLYVLPGFAGGIIDYVFRISDGVCWRQVFEGVRWLASVERTNSPKSIPILSVYSLPNALAYVLVCVPYVPSAVVVSRLIICFTLGSIAQCMDTILVPLTEYSKRTSSPPLPFCQITCYTV